MTTNTRQLRLTFNGILSHYGIDNLALEGKLCDAAKMYFAETKTGRDPAHVRADIFKALQIGVVQASERELLWNRAEASLKRIGYNPNGETDTDKEAFYKFLKDREKNGETIERFTEWILTDQFWHDKISQYRTIQRIWPKAFGKESFNPLGLQVGL